jgi:hypothetical protein
MCQNQAKKYVTKVVQYQVEEVAEVEAVEAV